MGCLQCGSEILSSVAVHYDEEVRKPSADPMELAPFAPPTRRASLWGFVLAILGWITMLLPAFMWGDVPKFIVGMVVLGMLLICLFFAGIFLWARRRDNKLKAEYLARRYCDHCGWYEL